MYVSIFDKADYILYSFSFVLKIMPSPRWTAEILVQNSLLVLVGQLIVKTINKDGVEE